MAAFLGFGVDSAGSYKQLISTIITYSVQSGNGPGLQARQILVLMRTHWVVLANGLLTGDF